MDSNTKTNKNTGNAASATEDKDKPVVVTCHDAAVDAFRKMFADYVKAKVLKIKDERRLSKEPLRIDILIIKKEVDVQIDNVIGRIFRIYNVIEFKSPRDKPTIHDFNKVIHGYVGIYAAQEKIALSDMTATIVCRQKPTVLFEALEKNNYRVLHKGNGIYYIILRGSVPEKSLLIQIVVYSELPDSELLLKAIGANDDRELVRKVLEYAETRKDYNLYASFWGRYFINQNPEILLKEMNMENNKRLEKALVKAGWTKRWEQAGEQKGIQKGMQKGISELLQFLKSGHSIEEAEMRFAVQ